MQLFIEQSLGITGAHQNITLQLIWLNWSWLDLSALG